MKLEMHNGRVMYILQLSNAAYSNQWLTVPKKIKSLCFILGLQLVNKMMICNSKLKMIINEFAKALIII